MGGGLGNGILLLHALQDLQHTLALRRVARPDRIEERHRFEADVTCVMKMSQGHIWYRVHHKRVLLGKHAEEEVVGLCIWHDTHSIHGLQNMRDVRHVAVLRLWRGCAY